MRRQRTLTIIAILTLFLAAACGGSGETPETPPAAEAQPESRVPKAPVTPEGKPTHGTITELEMGDVACYMGLATELGELWEMADFALCEDPNLIGQTVMFTWVETEVMADSCEGNPDCQETQTEWLISAVVPVK